VKVFFFNWGMHFIFFLVFSFKAKGIVL
jgi:hypothetical protein